jgi:hypothetical protein
MRKRKPRKPAVSALCSTPLPARRYEPVCRITFTPRMMPLTQAELDGLEIPAFLKR